MPLYLPITSDDRPKIGGTTYLSIPGVETSSVNTFQPGANRLHYMPIRLEAAAVLSALKVEVTTQGAASTTARLGVCAINTDLTPTALIVDAGTVAVDSQGVKTISLTQPLAAGLYALMLTTDASGVLFRRVAGGSRFAAYNATLGTSPFLIEIRVSPFTYGAFSNPPTAPNSVNNSNVPFTYFVFCEFSSMG